MALSLNGAQIVSLFMESAGWGVHLVLYAWAMSTLVEARRLSGSSAFWGVTTFATIFFLIGTLDTGVQVYITYEQFVIQGGSPMFNVPNSVILTSQADFLIQTLMGDAFLIYRLFFVYSKMWHICLLPALLWIGQVVCCIAIMIITQLELIHGPTTPSFALGPPFEIAQAALTFSLNVLATGAIVYRLYMIERSNYSAGMFVQGPGDSKLSKAARIMVESAALYTACQFVFFILVLKKNLAETPVSGLLLQIIGISFDLIIIRVHSATAIKTTIDSTRPTISFTTMNPFSAEDKASNANLPSTLYSAGNASSVTRRADSNISKTKVTESAL